jgi:phage regulator Rha-like protein
MGNLVKKNDTVLAINIQKVKDKIAVIRNLEVIADADVAELYGVETKRINEAVKNNPDKFPASYMFVLNKSEVLELRSKISTTNVSAMNRNPTKVFTERGLYMLATILKGEQARDMTFAIIETFVKVRELKRELLELHQETDKEVQKTKMQHFGEVLSDIVMPDLQTQETESSLEITSLLVRLSTPLSECAKKILRKIKCPVRSSFARLLPTGRKNHELCE